MDQTRLDVDLIPPEAEYFAVSTVAGLIEEDDPDAQVQWCRAKDPHEFVERDSSFWRAFPQFGEVLNPRRRVRGNVLAPDGHIQHALDSLKFAVDRSSLYRPVWIVPRRLLASIVFVSLDHLGIDLSQPAAPEGVKQMLPVIFESLPARLGKA
jgi:hypothetical protein